MNDPNTQSRYERGMRALDEIDGEAGAKVIAALADIAPDFARYLIEFPSATSIRAPASICAPARSRPSRVDRARQCRAAAQGAYRGGA